jgi:hypothetical protein
MNTQKIQTYFILLFSFLCLSGCKKENLCDCFKSTGSDIKEDRDATPFSQIYIEGKIDLVITQDTIERISVLGGNHLISNIETSISDGTLNIKNHNKCNFVRSYDRHMTVFVSVRHLHHLDYEGAGMVTATNILKDSSFTVDSKEGSGSIDLRLQEQVVTANLNTGPADINLSGSSPLLYVYSGGNGVMHINGLACPQIYLTNNGTGDIYIASDGSPKSLLEAKLKSSGDVYCTGRPAQIIQSRAGSGQLLFQ